MHKEFPFATLDSLTNVKSAIETIPTTELNPEEALIGKEQKEILYAAIGKLPETQRRALMLQLQGLSMKNIAEGLGTNEETAKNAVFRARRSLEKIFGKLIRRNLYF